MEITTKLSKVNLGKLCSTYRVVLKANTSTLPFYMKDVFNKAANLDFRNAR